MSQQEPPKIEFPCDYPIKVIADNHDEARGLVMDVMQRHAAPLAENCVSERLSREGRFMSMTITITATIVALATSTTIASTATISAVPRLQCPGCDFDSQPPILNGTLWHSKAVI